MLIYSQLWMVVFYHSLINMLRDFGEINSKYYSRFAQKPFSLVKYNKCVLDLCHFIINNMVLKIMTASRLEIIYCTDTIRLLIKRYVHFVIVSLQGNMRGNKIFKIRTPLFTFFLPRRILTTQLH